MKLRSSVALLLLLVAGSARADPSFPQEIVNHFNIKCTPYGTGQWDPAGCPICHRNDGGNCGTIINPFGKWVMAQGISCAHGNTVASALDPVLETAKSMNIDTNCDGVPDVMQLEQCEWQALSQDQCGADAGAEGGITTDLTENVIYGCSVSPTPTVPGVVAFAVGASLVMMVVRRRRGTV